LKDTIRHFKFIGGPWDGEYHGVKGYQPCIDACKPSTLRSFQIEPDVSFDPLEVTSYTLRRFAAGEEGEFSVWYYADSQWSDVYVLSQLVHHYPGRP